MPTNVIVQLLCSASVTTAPPLHFGYESGTDTNWFILDTAKIPRPGFVIGYQRYTKSSQLRCIVRALYPSGAYGGDGYQIPNPSVSGGLWIAQADVRQWSSGFPFHIHTGLWSFVELDPRQDTDEDGLTDAWGWRYFDHPTATEPGEDDDEDGFSNLEEAIADTHPRDSNSFLRVENISLDQTDDGIAVTWLARSNVHYGVEHATGMIENGWGFGMILSNVVVPFHALYSTNLPGSDPSVFYRVVAYPEEP